MADENLDEILSIEEIIVRFISKFWWFLLIVIIASFIGSHVSLDRVPKTYGVKALIRVAKVPSSSLEPKGLGSSLLGGSSEKNLSQEIKDYVDFKYLSGGFSLYRKNGALVNSEIPDSLEYILLVIQGPSVEESKEKLDSILKDVEGIFAPFIQYNKDIISEEIKLYKAQKGNLKNKMNEINKVVSSVGLESSIVSQRFEIESKIMAIDTLILSLKKKISPYELGNIGLLHVEDLAKGQAIAPKKTMWSAIFAVIVTSAMSMLLLFIYGRRFMS